MQNVEQVAQEAREITDALAARVGEQAEVVQDSIVNCIPGNRDSGKMLIYSIDVVTVADVVSRLPEIATSYEADGWTPRLDNDKQLRLLRDPMTLGVYINSEGTRASIQGSSGCVD